MLFNKSWLHTLPRMTRITQMAYQLLVNRMAVGRLRALSLLGRQRAERELERRQPQGAGELVQP